MPPQVINYKGFNSTDVKITLPEKNKGKYVSYICRQSTSTTTENEGSPLLIQSPVLEVCKQDNNELRLLVKKSNSFNNVIKSWDDYCIDYITNHSTEFFNNKRFSRNKIQASYIPTMKEYSNEYDILEAYVKHPEQLIIRDQRNNLRQYNELQSGNEIIAIFEFEGIVFKKDSMKLLCSVKQIKVYVNEPLTDWYIEQDDDEPDSDFTNPEDIKEIEAQLKSVEELNIIYKNQLTSNIQEKEDIEDKTETDNNDDDKDLF